MQYQKDSGHGGQRERAFVCNDICSISSRSPSRVRRQRSARQLSPPKRGNWTERPGGRGGGPLPLLSSPSSPRPFLSPLLFCFPPPCPCSLLLCSLPSCELPIQRLANGNADPSSPPLFFYLLSSSLQCIDVSLFFSFDIFFLPRHGFFYLRRRYTAGEFGPEVVECNRITLLAPLSIPLMRYLFRALYIYICIWIYIYIYHVCWSVGPPRYIAHITNHNRCHVLCI